MPYVVKPTPIPDTDIPTGVTEVGATVLGSQYNVPRKFNLSRFNYSEIEDEPSLVFAGVVPQRFNYQPFNRGLNTIGQVREAYVRLRLISVADNPDYTNGTEYVTEFNKTGTEFIIEHPFKDTGTHYIKMQAENENGDVSETLEYVVNVIIRKYFIKEPKVKTNGPQANKITVRSPSAEYTATTDPAPNPDKVIERVVEIDEGDATTREIVAKALIDRWGREQKSISGQINLTVTLKFKEKMKLVNNSINLDEEMVLQKKQHDVTGRKTDITARDIIIDDSELLSRILDDKKG